jgi:hypothetical protein
MGGAVRCPLVGCRGQLFATAAGFSSLAAWQWQGLGAGASADCDPGLGFSGRGMGF